MPKGKIPIRFKIKIGKKSHTFPDLKGRAVRGETKCGSKQG